MTDAGDVVIRAALRRALLSQAQRARPAECCGLLLGQGSRIEFAIPITNVAEKGRYEIDPAGHISVRRLLRDVLPALSIVGAYHSHPEGDARPSPTDIAESMYPRWIHVIVGLGSVSATRIRAFRIGRRRARELTIRWAPTAARLSYDARFYE